MKLFPLGLKQNLDSAVRQFAEPGSILVFPTRVSANRAAAEINRSWDMEQRLFLSVEELREYLILPAAPVLTDEKRLLCLYLVMGEEQREFFHILSYSDIVDWGKRFFDFFEELAEECIDTEELAGLGDSGIFHLQEWQEIYLERILSIRSDYLTYITSLGFTDSIFYFASANIKVPWTDKQLIYVNQYYYSALEKAQLKALEQAGNQVTLITHGVEFVNADSLTMQEFDLQSAWDSLAAKPEITILETDNETQMALAFLHWKQQNPLARGIVLDSAFYQKSYSRYFQDKGIALPHNYPFSECGIYQMLSYVNEGLRYVLANGGYLPVKLLANCLSNRFFVAYFLPADDPSELDRLSHEVLREANLLLQKDYLYVDEALFSEWPQTLLKRVVKGFYELLAAFSGVSSIEDLISVIDTRGGLELARVISSLEKEYTDIEAVFWERLGNFLAIEKLALLPSWAQVFPPAEIGQNLLELLLSNLKTARISFYNLPSESPNWEIGNLLDSRNRSFESVAVLQMVEGIMPSAPTPVWLFNEAQRAKLGLKTYADIRFWERYYFFRLLFTSRQGLCFYYSDPERDISASSFLGELSQLLSLKFPGVAFSQKVSIPLPELYAQNFKQRLLTDTDKALCCYEAKPPEDFFIIPSEPGSDYKNNTVCLGASGVIQLLKNPFIWYLEYYSKLQKPDWEGEETISGKLFGNIMHAYFASTLGQLKGKHSSLDKLQSVFADSASLESELHRLITSNRMRYQIPKNYNADFLSDILSRKLSESLFRFYEDWLKNRLERHSFTLIPEEEEMLADEYGYKVLGSVKVDNADYRLAIRGRADLRIELDSSALIVDFKTGNHDSRQLAIYEWFYYLLNNTLNDKELSSIFWNILKAEKTDGIKAEKRNGVKADILEGLWECLVSGYGLGKKASDRNRLILLTRADLYAAQKGEAKNE